MTTNLKRPQPRGTLIVSIVVLTGLALLLSLIVGEYALRALGYKPWAPWALAEGTGANRVVGAKLAMPDAVRGWTNRPGRFLYPGYSPAVERINVNIRPDGGRFTDAANTPFDANKPSILFVGGSITMGYAISDAETVAWKTQALYPDRNVFNYGVPGYGTYQSLLALEEVLPAIPGRKIIFYGLMEHHLNRNVLDAMWLQVFSTPGSIAHLPPYVSLGPDGQLVRHPTELRTPWYLKDKLAMVQLAETSYLKILAKNRNQDEREIFRKLMVDMVELGNANDAEVVVLFLKIQDTARPAFREQLAAENIRYAECMDDENLAFQNDYTVVGEHHPNGRLNTVWASCISDYIGQEGL